MRADYLFYAVASVGVGAVTPEAPALSGIFLDAVGVDMPMGAFLMGICFACAGGFVAMAFSPPENRVTKWATVFGACLIGILSAILHPHIPVVKELPAQAVMCLSGLSSRKLVERVRDLDFSLPWKGAEKK